MPLHVDRSSISFSHGQRSELVLDRARDARPGQSTDSSSPAQETDVRVDIAAQPDAKHRFKREAKAASQLESTDPGVVKGKFSYLSPEAASGLPVDHRADVFSCGILLYELVTGKRLYVGDTDYQTVELVRKAYVPPILKDNPEAPRELEDVIRKSLSRDANSRYQSARALGDSLAQVLFGHGLKVTDYDIANLVQGVLREKETQMRRESASVM